MALDVKVIRDLAKELAELQQSPVEGVRVELNEENVADIRAELQGPAGTPFEGGVFRMRLELDGQHPAVAPKGFFETKIFHPNVSATGEICVNVLKRDWKPDMGVRHILMVIRCLLIEPNPDSALNEEAGKLLLEDYEEFARRARLMTSIHAQAPGKQPLTASGANANANSADSGSGSPAVKKAKGAAGAATARRKAAKRL